MLANDHSGASGRGLWLRVVIEDSCASAHREWLTTSSEQDPVSVGHELLATHRYCGSRLPKLIGTHY